MSTEPITQPITQVIEVLNISKEFAGVIAGIVFAVHNNLIDRIKAVVFLSEMYRLETGHLVGPEHLRSLLEHPMAEEYKAKLIERKKRIDAAHAELAKADGMLAGIYKTSESSSLAPPAPLSEPVDNVTAAENKMEQLD